MGSVVLMTGLQLNGDLLLMNKWMKLVSWLCGELLLVEQLI